MDCSKINLTIFAASPTFPTNPSFPRHCQFSPSRPQPRNFSIRGGPQKYTTPATAQPCGTCTCSVDFQTLRDCKLGISRYPDFEYNAEGGKGMATGRKMMDEKDSSVSGDFLVSFDVGTVSIPPLTSANTRFLGLPLPPFLKIDIFPEFLGGVVNRETGKVDLEFKANFCFSVGNIYRAPPLVVMTNLTSEEVKGSIRGGKGERLDADGSCRLVGIARLDPMDDLFMDSFLNLPTECIAVLNARLLISGDT